MSASRSSTKENDLMMDNYLQHLVFKSIQSIVHSRKGLKQQTESQSFVPAWFNLQLDKDLTDVQDEVNVKTNKIRGPAACLTEPVCVEVVLRTTDDELITLEYWWMLRK